MYVDKYNPGGLFINYFVNERNKRLLENRYFTKVVEKRKCDYEITKNI